MSILDVAIIGLLFGTAWLWYDSMQVRDIALRAAKSACAADDIQLLDETVAIAAMGLARDDEGRLKLRRSYGFDFSDTGDNRRRGTVLMLGSEVLLVNIRV